ncbi:MAG: biopolymer transporter ExbD [Nannocystaceae bacterium]
MSAAGPAGGRRSRRFTDINMTPLVDVMLVLVIVFMITAPLLSAGVEVELPTVDGAAATADTALVVTVTATGAVFLGDAEITADVGAALVREPRLRAGEALSIRADKDARYGVVAEVVAAAKAAGVASLNLLVEPAQALRDAG